MNELKITDITVENFRGIERIECSLDPNINVIIGENGTGKSSLLDSVAIVMSWFTARAKSTRNAGLLIQPEEITNGRGGSTIEANFSKGAGVKSRFAISRKRPGVNLKENIFFEDVTRLGLELSSNFAMKDPGVSLPLFAYYPVNRMLEEVPIRVKPNLSFPQMELYADLNLTASVSLKRFFEWLRWRTDQGVKGDTHIAALQRAIESFMPGYSNLTYQRNPLRLTIDKQGNTLRVDQLSHGEKIFLSLIGDIVRRLSILNPSHPNPLNCSGIILIDEVDMHLHPNWQALIAKKMIEVFPNCQFFMTTCSSHISSGLDASMIINMGSILEVANTPDIDAVVDVVSSSVDPITVDMIESHEEAVVEKSLVVEEFIAEPTPKKRVTVKKAPAKKAPQKGTAKKSETKKRGTTKSVSKTKSGETK
ncbi:MAG: AAA family ATPase [Bacteroidales bacterium]